MTGRHRRRQHRCMNTIVTPQAAVAAATDSPTLPSGADERVAGFGVMGLPFSSGHYLAFRHFPASSFAPAYRSVWHRTPSGEWTFYATTPAEQSCSRYFSSATTVPAVQCEIAMTWTTPWSVAITIPGLLDWTVEMSETAATHTMSRVGRAVPEAVWARESALAVMSRLAGPLLGVGRLRLTGKVPNGQHYRVAPRQMWVVSDSTATIAGVELGRPAPLSEPDRLADFRLPQRGICVIGSARFDTFDPARHLPGTRTAPTRPRTSC